MQIGVLKSQSTPLVAMVPAVAAKYKKDGYEVVVEKGVGTHSFFTDEQYLQAGATIADKQTILSQCDIILVDTELSQADMDAMKKDAIAIGKFNILSNPQHAANLKSDRVKVFSLDLVPRSSIAQSMDVLSSLASLSGYNAVVHAALRFPGYFPMMTTAAGTVPPAKVLILGAGVAGLQAIATARRLGASVEAFDVRSAVKEEVQSLGAKFIEVPGAKEDAGAGGYAVTQTEEYIQKQRELIHERASKSDVVITTANIPGRKAPVLLEKRSVEAMQPGSVVIDMASATGGNCEYTQDEQEVSVGGVKIVGDSRLYHLLPKEASRLYSTNLYNFIKFVLKSGVSGIPYDHEIVYKTLISQKVEVLKEQLA